MEIVIKIPEQRFIDIQRIASVQLDMRTDTVEQIIANGTPLPKGHGDLFDKYNFRKSIDKCLPFTKPFQDYYMLLNMAKSELLKCLEEEQTIIVADKESD